MNLDGAWRNTERLGDLLVGLALRQELENIALARRETLQQVEGAKRQFAMRRINHSVAFKDEDACTSGGSMSAFLAQTGHPRRPAQTSPGWMSPGTVNGSVGPAP